MLMVDLFSGIGGFSLAGHWAGYETVGFCEIDPYCQRVLGKHWPGVPIHDDITTLSGDLVRRWSGGRGIDLVTGGFPCQPVSHAGKRRGAEDDRFLWPHMLRVLTETKPRRILGENVAGLVTMGLDGVLADLEGLGYACQAIVVPAAAVNAPHRRDRVWIMADADGGRLVQRDTDERGLPIADEGRDAADAQCGGQSGPGKYDQPRDQTACGDREAGDALDVGQRTGGETEPGLGGGHDGLSGGMVRPGLDRFPRVTTTATDRRNRLKALGNAIVPAVAYEILRAWEIA